MLIITSISACVLGLLFVKLSFDVIGFRRTHGVGLGSGGHEDLDRAIRAHSNFSEYAPIALILIACLELNQAPIWLVASLALIVVVGRIIHPIGMKSASISWSPRVRGMQLTLLGIMALCIINLIWAFYKLFI